MPDHEPSMPDRLILASPRGFCAGVTRAIDTVRAAVREFGAPIHVRRQIVHNMRVVSELERDGVIFVEEVDEVPLGGTVVMSAHGVSPEVMEEAALRELTIIDATCPLVAKVHREARKFARDGYQIILIGHDGHEEVEGTMGEAPEAITLVESTGDVAALDFPAGTKLAYLTQTTLSVTETARIIRALTDRYPDIVGPAKKDICYATTNRQHAVTALASRCDGVLVIGAANSSNSVRLMEVAREQGVPAWRVDSAGEIDERWFTGITTLGITSGASAPESLVIETVQYFTQRGASSVDTLDTVQENVTFSLPRITAKSRSPQLI